MLVRLDAAFQGGVHVVWGFWFVSAGSGDISVGRVLFSLGIGDYAERT